MASYLTGGLDVVNGQGECLRESVVAARCHGGRESTLYCGHAVDVGRRQSKGGTAGRLAGMITCQAQKKSREAFKRVKISRSHKSQVTGCWSMHVSLLTPHSALGAFFSDSFLRCRCTSLRVILIVLPGSLHFDPAACSETPRGEAESIIGES